MYMNIITYKINKISTKNLISLEMCVVDSVS